MSGQGSLEFKNTGNREIQLIAFDYAINEYQLLRLNQNGQELEIYNINGNQTLNNTVYFVLNELIDEGDSVKLNIEFKRRLFVCENPEEFKHQNLIPRLWWDGIPVSESFKIKLNELTNYTIAVSGRFNKDSGFYENDNALKFGFFFSKKCDLLEKEVKGVLVRVIYPKNGKPVADLSLQTACKAIPFYEDLTGLYPYKYLNILPGGPGVWGGYSFASGMVVIHAKGFSFISALEIAMGKENFKDAYQLALREFGGKLMGYREFQRICEKKSGENLDWFFKPWVKSNNYVSTKIMNTKWEKKGNTYINQISLINKKWVEERLSTPFSLGKPLRW